MSCLLLHNILPPTTQQQQTTKHLLTPSFCGLGSSAQGLSQNCNQGIDMAWGPISRLKWGGITSKLTHLLVGSIQFLTARWTKGLRSSRVVGVSCHVAVIRANK